MDMPRMRLRTKSAKNKTSIDAFTQQTMQGVPPMGAKLVINGVHVVPMGMANAFLIESDDGLTLIDAGFPAKEAAVFGAIKAIGRSADQLRHLIFTHGHPDHIGSAAAIVRQTSARTYMHPATDLMPAIVHRACHGTKTRHRTFSRSCTPWW